MNDFTNIKEHLITYGETSDQNHYVRAEGSTCYDDKGRSYIMMNEISCVLGYNHPRFTKELGNLVQTKMLGHLGTFSEEKEKLISNFMEVTHGDFNKIFFSSSGGEVVDWSLKIARKCTGKDGIISFDHALHGRSFAGAFISDVPVRKAGFGSGLDHIHFWEYPEDGREEEPLAEFYHDIAAIIIEPYQALGGMVTPSKAYWQWLRKYTKENGILLIFDEIQTGFGKTGSFFAYEETGIVPDILLAGKGMSNGFGLGALLMTKEVGDRIKPQEISGGSADNELMCSIMNEVFSIYQEENILEHVKKAGNYLKTELEKILEEKNISGKVHGKGLFLSLELPAGYAGLVVNIARQQGIILGRTEDKILFRPPLVITELEIQRVCTTLNMLIFG